MNRYRIKITGESGMGLESSGEILMRALKDSGYEVVSEREFPSLIKAAGINANVAINFSNHKIRSLSEEFDVIIALGKTGIIDALATATTGTLIIHNFDRWRKTFADLPEKVEAIGATLYEVNTGKITRQNGGGSMFDNTVLLGVIWAYLGFDKSVLEKELHKKFGKKESTWQTNLGCYNDAYNLKSELPISTFNLLKISKNTKIKSIFFDLDKVLVYNNLWSEDLEYRYNIKFEEKEWEKYQVDKLKDGFNWPEYIHQLIKAKNLDIKIEDIIEVATQTSKISKLVKQLLKKLKDQGYKLYITTDRPQYLCDLLVESNQLEEFFVETFTAYSQGSLKSESSYFEKIIIYKGLNADEILYVDDVIDNIEIARELGINARLHTGNAQNLLYSIEGELGIKIDKELMLIDGNTALGIGAVAAGVSAYYAYPMSPSSSILSYLAKVAPKTNMLVKQVEDEISAAVMSIGSMHMGARAFTSTSGGGFDLMTESVSLAGITETPLVIVIAQRPGPGTGLPTWTAQADLNLAIHAGHGEFARIVVAVGDPADAYERIQNAFDLAEKYQVPVLVLTEKAVAETRWTTPIFEEYIPVRRYLTDPALIKQIDHPDYAEGNENMSFSKRGELKVYNVSIDTNDKVLELHELLKKNTESIQLEESYSEIKTGDIIQFENKLEDSMHYLRVDKTKMVEKEIVVTLGEQLSGPVNEEKDLNIPGNHKYLGNRFQLTESGVSPRWLPGSSKYYYFANGDEHKENGMLDESADSKHMIMKRVKKLETIKSQLPDPVVHGPAIADITLIGMGSSKNAALDVINNNPSQNTNYLDIQYLWPLNKDFLIDFLSKNKNATVIEQNATGQLANLIKSETGIELKSYLKYDGRQFKYEDIQSLVK